MPIWIKQLPDVDPALIERAKEIYERKNVLREQMDQAYRDEAALYLELNTSGQYSNEEMTKVLVCLENEVVARLPERMPPRKRQRPSARKGGKATAPKRAKKPSGAAKAPAKSTARKQRARKAKVAP